MNTRSVIKSTVDELFSGTIMGILLTVWSYSIAAIIFYGPLQPYFHYGLGILLFSAFVANIVVFSKTNNFSIFMPQDTPAIVIGIAAFPMAEALVTTGRHDILLPTVAIYIALSTAITGLFYYGLGKFHLSNLIRHIPFPVVGGFLAGTGWLIFKSCSETLLGMKIRLDTLSLIVSHGNTVVWTLGTLFALTILISYKKLKNPIVFIYSVAGGIIAFNIYRLFAKLSLQEGEKLGVIFKALPKESFIGSIPFQTLGSADFELILRHIPTLILVIFVSTLGLLFNVTGLELASKREINFDNEMKETGFKNLIISVLGGGIAYHSISFSVLNFKLCPDGKHVSKIAGLFCALVLFSGSSAETIRYLPKFVIVGLVMYVGIGLLYEWLLEKNLTLSRADKLIIFTILIIVMKYGFLEGILVGLSFSIVMFVVNYAQLPVVTTILTGNTYKSVVERGIEASKYLEKNGYRIFVFRLQGFLFFGTGYSLLNIVRDTVRKYPTRVIIVFDFKLVTGVDSSALLIFSKLQAMNKKQDRLFAFSGISDDILRLIKSDAINDDFFKVFPNLDFAVEWAENVILKEKNITERSPMTLEQVLDGYYVPAEHQAVFMTYCQQLDISKGDSLIEQGAEADSFFIISEGLFEILLETPEGDAIRLRTITPGALVGEIGIYTGAKRSAHVKAITKGMVHRVDAKTLEQLEADHPQTAICIHKLVVKRLSRALTFSNGSIQALIR